MEIWNACESVCLLFRTCEHQAGYLTYLNIWLLINPVDIRLVDTPGREATAVAILNACENVCLLFRPCDHQVGYLIYSYMCLVNAPLGVCLVNKPVDIWLANPPGREETVVATRNTGESVAQSLLAGTRLASPGARLLLSWVVPRGSVHASRSYRS